MAQTYLPAPEHEEAETEDDTTVYIVIFGNPVDGLGFCGPFSDWDEASEYADRNGRGDGWWITPLLPPQAVTGVEGA